MKYATVLLCLWLVSACTNSDYVSDDEQQLQNKPSADGAYFRKTRITAKISWGQTPQSDLENSFILNFSGNLNLFDDVAVKIWKPSEQLISIPVKIERINPAQYKITDVYFLTSGQWDIRIILRKNETVIDSSYASMEVP